MTQNKIPLNISLQPNQTDPHLIIQATVKSHFSVNVCVFAHYFKNVLPSNQIVRDIHQYL